MTDWMTRAACGPDTADLFADPAGGPDANSAAYAARTAMARKVCTACPVLADCRAWAVDELPFTFAGGMTADERAKVRKARHHRVVRAAAVG